MTQTMTRLKIGDLVREYHL